MKHLVLINLDPSRDTSRHVRYKKDKITELGLDLTCVVWTRPQSGESTPIIDTLESKLRELNGDPEVVGVCFISPLPEDLGPIDLGKLCLLLDKKKDTEGLRNGSLQNVLAEGLDYYLEKTGLSKLSPYMVITRCTDMMTPSFIDTLRVRQYDIEVVPKPSPAEPEDESRAIRKDDGGLFQHKVKSIDIIDETKRQVEEWKGQNAGKLPRIGLVIDSQVPPADIHIDLRYRTPGDPKPEHSNLVMLDGKPVWPQVSDLAVRHAAKNMTK